MLARSASVGAPADEFSRPLIVGRRGRSSNAALGYRHATAIAPPPVGRGDAPALPRLDQHLEALFDLYARLIVENCNILA